MLDRFLLGSVSQAVALHAKCSVEIVRSPKRQTSDSKWQFAGILASFLLKWKRSFSTILNRASCSPFAAH
jgi:Universal stress protein family